jgi:hypothetical protein
MTWSSTKQTNVIHYRSPWAKNSTYTLCGIYIDSDNWTNFDIENVSCKGCKRELKSWIEYLENKCPDIKNPHIYMRAKPGKRFPAEKSR